MVENTFYKTFSMDSEAKLLKQYLEREFPGGNYYSAYEAGFCGFSVHRKLEKLGINNIVVNAADIPTTDKERRQKEDKRDSRKIARSLKNGELTAIHIPKVEIEELRSLVRYRKTLSKELARQKNRIKSFLKIYGIEAPESINNTKSWSSKYIKWLESVRLSTLPGEMVLKESIDTLQFLRQKKLKILRELRKISTESKYKEDIKILRSIPGIGLINSLTILTEVGDITRFKTLDKLCSYIGLIPSTNSSGEKEKTGRITNRSNKELRSMIIESAWVAIRHDPALVIKFNKLIKRMKPNNAIIRIAKKLINRIRYVLKNKQEYENSIV
jgi:transposase